jgi:hypothetical protein
MRQNARDLVYIRHSDVFLFEYVKSLMTDCTYANIYKARNSMNFYSDGKV